MPSPPSSDRRTVLTPQAPAPIGPYSQAVVAGGFVWTAGQIAIVPETGEMGGGATAAGETEQVLKNLAAVLEAAGSDLAHVVRCDIFLADLADFAAVNEVYARFFPSDPPARVTVEAARLPRDARVEIAAIGVRAKTER